MIDAEAVISDYLRADTDVIALEARVVGKTPSDTTLPWVQVVQIDAPVASNSQADHLIAYHIDLSCYAGSTGGQDEALLLNRTVREALRTINEVEHADGVVVSGVRVLSNPRVPDERLDEPARERYVLSVQMWAHD